MTCYSHDRDRPKTGGLLYLSCQCSYDCSRLSHDSELLARQSECLEDVLIQVSRHRIKHLRSRSDCVFADCLAREHIDKCIRDKQYLIRMLKSLRSVSLKGVKLEKRVEIHELDTGTFIYLRCRHLFEEFLLSSDSMLVAIAVRHTQKLPVRPEECKIASPCVYAYGFDADSLRGNLTQSS